jgi:glycerol uptake facilitator-like aquaporin
VTGERTFGEHWRALGAETLGTALLALAVVGSGAHGTALSDDVGVVLLINSLATAAVLGVLIAVLLPTSGAHFNPVVSLVMALRRDIAPARALWFVGGQVVGAVAGSSLAHALFTSRVPTISANERISGETFVSEIIATAGLVAIIVIAVTRGTLQYLPALVALWIGAGYFITPSTGFANPAITIGRVFTDTFTGIQPVSALWFIAAQLLGAVLGWGLASVVEKKVPSRA